jgi:nickel/cobalt exporter
MGNFSINHYARFQARPGALALRYILDFAEIPTVTERTLMHADESGRVNAADRDAYLHQKSAEMLAGLSLTINAKSAAPALQTAQLAFQPGSGGLPILRVILDTTVPLAGPVPASGWKIAYQDNNYATRTGWKEILAQGGEGMRVTTSTVPTTDISRELTGYPTDPGAVPLRLTEATFTVQAGGAAGRPVQGASAAGSAPPTASGTASTGSRTPQDAFTQAIAAQKLTGGVMALALGLSFIFGAFHALSPGHGKTMVAAYLVGTRGTAKHAVFLGLVVTLTHTIGVFALGLVTFVAARYIVPERLYPILSGLSGLGILVIGLGMLWTRVAAMRRAHAEGDDPNADDDERESFFQAEESADPLPGDSQEEPLSLRTLLVLGITGGILPCPSALVVMLSAIYLHRIAFGMTMIVAFSLGLASVLTIIGILVVRARGWLERLPLTGALTTRLPVISAAIVTCLGLVLLVRACNGGF